MLTVLWWASGYSLEYSFYFSVHLKFFIIIKVFFFKIIFVFYLEHLVHLHLLYLLIRLNLFLPPYFVLSFCRACFFFLFPLLSSLGLIFFPPHSLFFLLYTIFVVFMITLETVTWVLMKVRFLKCLYHAS